MKNKRRFRLQNAGRRLVQAGFMGLFLFPLGVALYQKITLTAAPVFASWLLPWDPALHSAQSLHRAFATVVIGAPLLLLVLSFLFGRFFCGWVCPLGSFFDFIRPLFFWQRRRRNRPPGGLFPPGQNHPARYFLLVALLAASLLSLKWLGVFDPLVIFNRAAATLITNLASGGQPGVRTAFALLSIIFVAILGLEMWQPRFWCRNLCPQGAFLSLVSRFSLLRRFVREDQCTGCAQCQVACPMNAISGRGQVTNPADCTLCLECEPSCPRSGIGFAFSRPTRSVPVDGSRRHFLSLAAAGAAGAALVPLAGLAPRQPVLRPPGALPEAEFLRRCILCQECIRVCPTGALSPAFLESGLAGMGTPVLVPRQGGCALNPSCPNLCASVCPVGALQPTTREKMQIGLAHVHRDACLAWDQGAKCLVCVEACLNSAAIPVNGRVTVDPNRCTGCGRCESGCPVPGSAIRVEPLDMARNY